MKNGLLFVPLAAFLLVSPTAVAEDTAPTVEQLQSDFRDLGFGMFIHYNMATYHGVQWVEGYPCPSTFDPGGPVDTDAWADAAKAAGMTYGVLTTKHVAGFCLWDSDTTEYDIMRGHRLDGQSRAADHRLWKLVRLGEKRQAVSRHRRHRDAAFSRGQHPSGRDLLEARTEVVLGGGLQGTRLRRSDRPPHAHRPLAQCEFPAECRPGQTRPHRPDQP